MTTREDREEQKTLLFDYNFSRVVVIIWAVLVVLLLFFFESKAFFQYFFIPALLFSFTLWPLYTLINPGAFWEPLAPFAPPQKPKDLEPFDVAEWLDESPQERALWEKARKRAAEEEESRYKEFKRLHPS